MPVAASFHVEPRDNYCRRAAGQIKVALAFQDHTTMLRSFIAVLLLGLATQALAEACLIESSDDQVAIRMCQQNINIPPPLFRDSFCQPQIPERSFEVEFMEACPPGAYGICDSARSQGVAYSQTIHYYSDPDDQPVLKAYCEQFSQGQWRDVETPVQNGGAEDD